MTKEQKKKSNVSKYQKFEAITINRKMIKNAPYNPRVISDENLKLLKRNIRKTGLLETLVWNKTTGNLVSGHQRLKIIDSLEKRDDYDLTVAVVELDEKAEKEQNIFMNNRNAMGDWDRDTLMAVIPDIDLKEAGFNEVDMAIIGIEFDIDRHQDDDIDKVIATFEEAKEADREETKLRHEMAAKSHDNKENSKKDWKEIKQQIKAKHETEIADDYCVITFDNYKNKAAFMERFGFNVDERYIKGELFEKEIERV